MRRVLFFSLLSLPAAFAHGQALKCPDAPSHIVIENGSYGSQPGVDFQLHHFAATLVPLGKTEPMCQQKMTEVAHAVIFVSNESLTRVFAGKLAASDSKIRNLTVQHGNGNVTLRGEITKIIPIKFSIEGPVSTDGKVISVNVTKIDADGIPVKLLLTMVGEHIASLFNFKGVSGVTVEGNTMSFSPEKIAHLKGHISSLDATPKGLTLHYGPKPRAGAARPKA